MDRRFQLALQSRRPWHLLLPVAHQSPVEFHSSPDSPLPSFQTSSPHRLRSACWLLLTLLLALSQPLLAAEEYMEVEYSPFTYTIWRPNTDLSPDNDAILFNFCYYNDSRLDSWCDGISIYVDDEYVGKMTNMAGDEHNNTFILTEKISINSTKNGKVEA